MSRFYIPLDKITGTKKDLPDFSPVTSIDDSVLYYAFSDCSGLTGSVSFPSLTTIGEFGLISAFDGCSGITEVHFKSSLSGNSDCTASIMGCMNATVYFDLP